MAPRCPPGVFCLSTGVVAFFTLVICGVMVAVMNLQSKPITVHMPAAAAQAQQAPQQQINIRGGDDRYSIAPQPLRSPFDMRGPGPAPQVPFGMATQGPPAQYQSYGFITTSDGQTLPLYGRRTTNRSDRFNYYTRTDTYNPIPIPIRYKGRDCQDSIGCDELFDNEEVWAINGKHGQVKIYQFGGPTYSPDVM